MSNLDWKRKPEMLAEARRLWGQDVSAGTIAKQLGVTRGTLLGFIHRHRAWFPKKPPGWRRPDFAKAPE